MTRQARGSNEM